MKGASSSIEKVKIMMMNRGGEIQIKGGRENGNDGHGKEHGLGYI